jgi:hypothetical protein
MEDADREMVPAARLLAVVALVLGPLFWCVGLLLRTLALSSAGFTTDELARHAAEPFAVREQLAAYAANPALTTAGFASFLIGSILLIPATWALARLAARRSPRLAVAGGALVILGLVARVYFAGVEQTAFQLAGTDGVDTATATILGAYVDVSYGPWRIAVTSAFGQYLGMPLLAAALYRSGVVGGARVVILLWSATMWAGVLKTAGWGDVIAAAALAVALGAVAVQLSRGKLPSVRDRRLVSW